MNTHTSTYSSKIFTYEILDHLHVKLEIQQNPYGIPLEDLFLLAARMNKKRAFLFVSKVLGKHIPIKPIKGIQVGFVLAARYLEIVMGRSPEILDALVSQFNSNKDVGRSDSFIDASHNPIVIGFAETATALGHAFFEAFHEADFFHTTREILDGNDPTITFEEEHSHATSHRVYVNQVLLESDREIILVDDELTTGKTAINIIRSIHARFPRKVYTVVSILDWRSEENVKLFKELEQELGITIYTVSLVKGTVTVIEDAKKDLPKGKTIQANTSQHVAFHPVPNPAPMLLDDNPIGRYTLYTGRFGLTSAENKKATNWAKRIGTDLAKVRTGQRTLVLGSGEYMYLPMKIASFMGENVFYQSTTRSPIYPVDKENYGAKNRYSFPNPEDLSIDHFVYNIAKNEYEDIFLFFERKVEENQLQKMLDELKNTNISDIKVVYLS